MTVTWDQIKSIVRAATNLCAGSLATHGLIAADDVQIVVSIVLGLAALVWGHISHAPAPPDWNK